jgi:hypothetical protein
VLHIDPVSEQDAKPSDPCQMADHTRIYATRPRRRTAPKSRTDAARKNYALFRQCFSDGVW